MKKIVGYMGAIRIISALLDVIALMYFALYMYWIFAVLDMDNHPLSVLFIKINPMTIGTYFMGISMILHLIAFRNSVGRCIICIPYILSIIVSLIAVMGMTGWNDLIMYVPHIIIIMVAIAIIVKQIKHKYQVKRN